MIVLLATLGCAPAPQADDEVTVLAASSLVDVLPPIGAAWTAETGQAVAFTFDGSSRLARQVEAGLVADVVFLADTAWMEWLAERDLVRPSTRRDLLGNDLVVVVSADTPPPAAPADLVGLPRLAMAGESVPAGRYGRAALDAAGVWDDLAPRVVSGDSVRTVLEWVAAGDAPAGVVYATDARAEPRVRVAFGFPADSHPPVVYPIAVTTASRHDHAEAFAAWCASTDAGARFEAAGFRVLAP